MDQGPARLGAVPPPIATGTGSDLRRPLGMTIIGGLAVSQLLTPSSARQGRRTQPSQSPRRCQRRRTAETVRIPSSDNPRRPAVRHPPSVWPKAIGALANASRRIVRHVMVSSVVNCRIVIWLGAMSSLTRSATCPSLRVIPMCQWRKASASWAGSVPIGRGGQPAIRPI
jgi:hypothetical protein